MAWQLIYTSAPRLLDAGRSGFGTVARHREIPTLVVAAVERFSQFSRQPGLAPGRVIYAHRHLTISGRKYHALSCIRDAGSDHTGRTNHLAHHLIAEAWEVTSLGVSPADVLRHMRWLGEWTRPPQWLEGAETLANFAPATAGDGAHWAALTGDPRHADLLVTGEAARGCSLLVPSGVDLRLLLAESLCRVPGQGWSVPFTTSLQPGDEPADFRWLGLEASRRGEAAGRHVLDLSDPASLPTPFTAPTPWTERDSAVETTSEPEVYDSGPVQVATNEPIYDGRYPTRKEYVSGTPERETRRGGVPGWVWITAAAAVVLLVAGLGGLVLYRGHVMKEEREEMVAGLPEFAKREGLGEAALAGLRWGTRGEAIELSAAADAVSLKLRSGEIADLETQGLQKAITKAEAARMEVGAYRQVLIVASKVIERRDQVKQLTFLGAEKDTGDALLTKLIAAYPNGLELKQVNKALRELWLKGKAASLLEGLRANSDRQLSPGNFESALVEVNQKNVDQAALPDLQALRWLVDDWKDCMSGKPLADAKTPRPQWLVELGKQTASKDAPAIMAEATNLPKVQGVQAENRRRSTYVVTGLDDLGKLPVPNVPPEIDLRYSAGTVQKRLRRINETLSPEDDVRVKFFKVSDGEKRITRSDDAPKPPFSLIGGSQGKDELFVVEVLSGESKEPFLGEHGLGVNREGDRLILTGKVSVLEDFAVGRLALSLPPPFPVDTEGKPAIIEMDAHGRGSVTRLLEAPRKRLEELEKGAKRLRAKPEAALPRDDDFESVRSAGKGIAMNLQGAGAELWKKKFDQKASHHVIGDLARAFAVEWSSDKDKRFAALRACGEVLSNAKPEDVAKANEAVLTEIQMLLEKVKDKDKPIRLRSLQSLAKRLKPVSESTAAENQAQGDKLEAEKPESQALALPADPLLDPAKVPPGEYRLYLRSTSDPKRQALLAVITVPTP